MALRKTRIEITECNKDGIVLFWSDGSIETKPYEYENEMIVVDLDPNNEIFVSA